VMEFRERWPAAPAVPETVPALAPTPTERRRRRA